MQLKQQHVTNSTTTSDIALPPSSEAARLKALKAEYQQLTKRLEEIREEVKATFANLNQLAPPGIVEGVRPGRRPPVENPRPITDKISIAAGRAIVIAMRKKKSPEQCKAEGIAAAQKVAAKYGMDKLPPEIVALIDKKIQTRFNL